MKRLLMIAALAAGVAGAQVPAGVGGAVGGGVSGAVGTVGAGAQAGVDATGALNGANSTVRALDDSARESAREASDRAARVKPPKSAEVRAGAGTRVDRGTRCYADYDTARAYPYDPYYDGSYYYCERRAGPGVAAGAKVKVGG